jgi:hypothetical protein
MTDQDDQRRPIDQVLGGLTIHPLPDRWSPLEGIVLVKCLDEEGVPTWAFRTTSGINDEELLGVLTVRIELLKSELLEGYDEE